MKMDKQKVAKAREKLLQHYPQFPIPESSYLILETPRSGSTLLSAHLQKIEYGFPIEAFNLNANYRKRFNLIASIDDPVACIRKGIEFQTRNRVMGTKFHRSQFQNFQRMARNALTFLELTFTDGEVTELFFPNAKFIFLQRKQKIRQAISYSKALQTGIWNETTDQDQDYKKYVLPALYDREHIEACFDMLLADDFAWKNFLESNDFRSLHIWFDDLVTNYEAKMKEIYTYLGVKGSEKVTPLLRQQSNKESLEWEKRFCEETPWTKDAAYMDAVARDDLDSLWAFRGQQIVRANEHRRWIEMPATRYKSVRSFWFRVQRKLKELISAKTEK